MCSCHSSPAPHEPCAPPLRLPRCPVPLPPPFPWRPRPTARAPAEPSPQIRSRTFTACSRPNVVGPPPFLLFLPASSLFVTDLLLSWPARVSFNSWPVLPCSTQLRTHRRYARHSQVSSPEGFANGPNSGSLHSSLYISWLRPKTRGNTFAEPARYRSCSRSTFCSPSSARS